MRRFVRIFPLCAVLLGMGQAKAGTSIPAENLRKLPELSLARNARFESEIHPLDRQQAVITADGKRYAGFRFMTPGYLDGSIEWLAVDSGTQGRAATWLLADASGKILATAAPDEKTAMDFPRIAGAFPNAKALTHQRIAHSSLQPNQSYALLRPLTDNPNPPLAVSITVDSPTGHQRFGHLQGKFTVPERPLSSEEVVAGILTMKAAGNAAGAVAFLRDELDKRANDTKGFTSVFYSVWKEAQVVSGRTDDQWAADLFGQLFTSAHKHLYFHEMYDATNNTALNLANTGNYGRLSEVFEIWREGLMLGGHRMDPSAYPDMGIVFPYLPEVRLREIPISSPYANATLPGNRPRSLPEGFSDSKSGTFILYAGHQSVSGRWQEALEWLLWLRKWASSEDGQPNGNRGNTWYGATENLSSILWGLNYPEEALEIVEQGMAARYGTNYRGRPKILLAMQRLDLLLTLERIPADFIEQAKMLVAQTESHVHINQTGHFRAKQILAKGLIQTGSVDEGMAMIEEMAKTGNITARITLIDQKIRQKKSDGVEDELKSLLKKFREAGYKSLELNLYGQYVSLLMETGRFGEALLLQREMIRLCHVFKYHNKLPYQSANLAVILEQLGDMDGAAAAAREARTLSQHNRTSEATRKQTGEILAKLKGKSAPVATPEKDDPLVDFQPEQSIVIPIKGAAWTTSLTLTNPSARLEEGSLSYEGDLPVTFSRENEQGDIIVRPSKEANATKATTPLRLEAGTYQLIRIIAEADPAFEGAMTFTWTSSRSAHRETAGIRVEAPESGVSSSIIQAGNYRANPFYGVPVHLHYVTKTAGTKSVPLRFIASETTRVEVYALDGTPLCIDGQGNGTLRDAGDELFASSDGAGNMQLPLKDGSASFMILLYPKGPLPVEGITLSVEAFQGSWELHSQNRLQP